MILLGMILISLYGIDLFSRQQFIGSDKKAKIQNEAAYIAGHISKHLIQAIGDVVYPAVVINPATGVTKTILVTIDSTADGIKNYTNDANISYCYNSTGCNNTAVPYAVYYNPNISSAAPPPGELLANHVLSLSANLTGNCVNLTVVTCWDPSQSLKACGTMDNPSFSMNTTIRMPSVSAQ